MVGAVWAGFCGHFGNRRLNAFGALNASTFAPLPELIPISNITTAGATELRVTVKYTDDAAVNAATFDTRDIEITRRGFSEFHLQPVSVSSTLVAGVPAAEYRFTAPGGIWDATDNGHQTQVGCPRGCSGVFLSESSTS